MEKITADMTFREVLQKYPKLARIFLKHGLHCIGCPLASAETIMQGCLAHGMDKEKIDALLKELNKELERE